MKVQVLVRLKSGVLDVQGKAVEHGIESLGYKNVNAVRIGKLIEFEMEEGNLESAKKKAAELCDKFLVNTIIENYEVKLQN